MSRDGTVVVTVILICILFMILACGLATPTPEPTMTPAPTATWTPTPTATPTPRFVMLPPPDVLLLQVAAGQGMGFSYIKVHYVPADTVVWVLYGWPEKEDALHRAIFEVVGGEWTLMGTEPMVTPTPEPGRRWPEGEALR